MYFVWSKHFHSWKRKGIFTVYLFVRLCFPAPSFYYLVQRRNQRGTRYFVRLFIARADLVFLPPYVGNARVCLCTTSAAVAFSPRRSGSWIRSLDENQAITTCWKSRRWEIVAAPNTNGDGAESTPIIPCKWWRHKHIQQLGLYFCKYYDQQVSRSLFHDFHFT